MPRLARSFPLTVNPPETTHAMLVWANPVFVREQKKRVARCQSVLAPMRTAGRAASLHLI